MSISEPRVEVVEEPGRHLVRAYSRWVDDVTTKFGEKRILALSHGVLTEDEMHGVHTEDEIYESARENIPVEGITERDITALVQDRQNGKQHPLTNRIFGHYLSAVINASSVDRIELQFKPIDGGRYFSIGYKLAPKKTLIAQRGSMIGALGAKSEGNVFNDGDVEILGPEATGGIRVNRNIAGKSYSRGGTDLNFGRMEEMDRSLLKINYAKVKVFGYISSEKNDSVDVNLGDAVDQALEVHHQCILVNDGSLWRLAKDAWNAFVWNNGDVTFMDVYPQRLGVAAINWRNGRIKRSEVNEQNPQYWDFGTIEQGVWPDHPKPKMAWLRGDGAEGKIRTYSQGLELVVAELRRVGKDPSEKRLIEYDWNKARERIVQLSSAIKEIMKQTA